MGIVFAIEAGGIFPAAMASIISRPDMFSKEMVFYSLMLNRIFIPGCHDEIRPQKSQKNPGLGCIVAA
jgi:hypothetical protein